MQHVVIIPDAVNIYEDASPGTCRISARVANYYPRDTILPGTSEKKFAGEAQLLVLEVGACGSGAQGIIEPKKFIKVNFPINTTQKIVLDEWIFAVVQVHPTIGDEVIYSVIDFKTELKK